MAVVCGTRAHKILIERGIGSETKNLRLFFGGNRALQSSMFPDWGKIDKRNFTCNHLNTQELTPN